MSALRVGFVVQGEGRGHMTQALTLGKALTDMGHRIESVLVGASPHRSVPDYFSGGFPCRVESFAAPTQVPGPDRVGVSAWRTAVDAARRFLPFWRGGFRIADAARQVDVMVNFLDLVGGLSKALLRWQTPTVAVAHNYVFRLPELSVTTRGLPGRKWLDTYERITSVEADAEVALSFDALDGRRVGLRVAPPLIGAEVSGLKPSDDGFLVCYALNAGSAARVVRWQRENRQVPVHCFVDGGTASVASDQATGCHVHDLDRRSFLDHLSRCRAYVGTAGFESLCEAHYLGKPILAIPTAGQLEQRLNALDAERCGVARAGGFEDLGDFWDSATPPDSRRVAAFRQWVDSGPAHVAALVEETAREASR